MRLHRLIFLIAVSLTFLVAGCSSNDDKDNPAGTSGPTDAELDDAMEKTERQADYYNQGAALAAVMDTAAAIDSLVSLLEADPDVDWVNAVNTGVNIRWKSGLAGIITLRLLIEEQAGKWNGAHWVAPGAPFQTRSGIVPADKAFSGGYHMPKNKKTLHLSPCYAEWESVADEVNDSAAAAFPRAGFEPFTFKKNEEVTLNVLQTVASGGYGVIRLGTHGSPWPSENDIQEVYIITGETPTRESFIAHWEQIDRSDLAIGAYAGGKRYYMNSLYFATYNNFGDDLPLIALSFCFGYMGYWPGDLMIHSKAGGVFGWDWEVRCRAEAVYVREMIRMMCDTTQTYPATLKRAHATGDTSYTETDGRVVSFHARSVADSFGLWTPFRIDSLVPDSGEEGDTIAVHGVGFGESGNSSVWFDDRQAAIVDWASTMIKTTVPSGLDGYVYVNVRSGDKESNSESFLAGADTLLALLQRTDRVDVVLNGDFRAGDGDFAYYSDLQPVMVDLQWNDVGFSAVKNETWTPGGDGEGTLVETITGTVSSNGKKIVTLTYTLDSDSHIPADEYSQASFSETDIAIAITYLDLEEVRYGVPEYFVEGPEMQNHITIQFRRVSQGSTPGDPVITYEYTHTDWNNPEEWPHLHVYFEEIPSYPRSATPFGNGKGEEKK